MNKFSTVYIFMKCIDIILKNEGGLVDNPNDPGRLTNMGICRLFYPDLDIRNLTRDEVVEIYYNDYWSKMNLIDIFDENLILQIFDFGVNTRSKRYGFNTALKAIQRIVNAKQDGVIGPKTIGLINTSPNNLVSLYKQERKKYYIDLARRKPRMQEFLNGWLKRINHCKFL